MKLEEITQQDINTINRSEPPKDEFVDSINLPSRFQLYDFKELRARPLRVSEVKKVRAVLVDGKLTSLTDAIAPAFSQNPRLLTHGDFWFTLAWIRINTFRNSPMKIEWKCRECDHENETILQAQDMDQVNLEEEVREPIVVTLPGAKEEVKLRLRRVGDEDIVDNYLKGISPGGSVDTDDRWLVDLAVCFLGMQIHDAHNYLVNLKNPDDVLFIEQVLNEFDHGINTRLELTCDGKGGKCGYVETQLRLNFQAVDIFPDRLDRERIKQAIRFGESSEHVAD